jgi:protein-disulfide isomerase
MIRRSAYAAGLLAIAWIGMSWAQNAAPAKSAAKAGAAGHAAAPTGPGALDKATLEAYVRHLLMWSAQIGVKIADPIPAPMPGFRQFVVTGSYNTLSVDETFYVSNDGQKIVRGEVFDVAQSPFAGQLSKLHTDGAPSLGAPGAKVALVLFTDFECPYCKEESKLLRENLLKTYPSEVRLSFKEMPLVSIHPWAKAAAMAGRCVLRQNAAAFWEYHDWAFANQETLSAETLRAKVLEWATGKGLDTGQLGACLDQRQTEAEVDRSMAEGHALHVNQTPTMFINGRPVAGSATWEQLKNYIDWELDHARQSAAEAESCCTVALPTPGKKK